LEQRAGETGFPQPFIQWEGLGGRSPSRNHSLLEQGSGETGFLPTFIQWEGLGGRSPPGNHSLLKQGSGETRFLQILTRWEGEDFPLSSPPPQGASVRLLPPAGGGWEGAEAPHSLI